MENAPNHGYKSTTTVTISLPNDDATADSSSEEHQQPIVNESTQKNQLVRDMDSNALQLKHMKAAADNFKSLLAEKEKTLDDLKVGIQLLKQSFRPLDDKIQTTRKSVHEKRAGDLDLLLQKIKDSNEWEKKFTEAISDYKSKIDGKNASLRAQRRKMAEECDTMERTYDSEVEDTKASLKELNKVHKQALADHVKLSDEKKFQLEKMDQMKQEMLHMRDQLENAIAERAALKKQSLELDAHVIELEALAKQERESPALLKIDDNKRNLAMRMKQISEASTLRGQKKQSLTAQKAKLTNNLQERDLLTEERKGLENAFNQQMNEQNKITAEIVSTLAELENTRKRTDEFEAQMNQKLNEARRKSEMLSNELKREMEGVRRESVHFVNRMQQKQRAEQEQMEQCKEQLRDELESMDQMVEVLKRGHQLEMDSKLRHFARVERDLEVFSKGEKEGNEKDINHIKGKIEKLGVERNTAQAEFDEKQAELKMEIELLSRQLTTVKTAADASSAIAESNRRMEMTKNLVHAIEQEIEAKKAKHVELHRDAFDLKNGKKRPIENSNSPSVKSPGGQGALRQAPDNFSHRMPKLDGPVTKWQVQRANGEMLEHVSVAGTAGRFTTQTLSRMGTDSNPATYHVETQQMEMTRPGCDSNQDCTTKFRKVVYSGKGIDMNVMNEAKRILEIHQNGVTRESAETEEEFRLRKVLVKKAADLEKMMLDSEIAQNSPKPSCHNALRPNEKLVEEEMARAQAVFAQFTQLITRNQHQVVYDLNQTLTQLEADLHQDGQRISNMKNGTRKQGEENK